MPPADRRRELTLGPIAPWHTMITVDAIETNHGRQTTLPHDHLFEVGADWFGPPMVGMPPSLTPVASRDVYVLTNLEDARALAHKAAAAFAAGGDSPPDLRELATGKTALDQSREPRFGKEP
jgi:hypothetical protein